MLLTIHIDNRNILLGCYENGKLAATASLGTDLTSTADQYAVLIRQVLSLYQNDTDTFSGAAISSVVPALTHTMVTAAHHLTQGKVLLIGPGIKTGVNLQLESAGTVGSDFICNAAAALDAFHAPLIVLHMANAITFSGINENRVLCARSILPGMLSSLAYLCESSAQLPDISLDLRAKPMGKSTVDAMQSGILYGTVSMVSGMLSHYYDVFSDDAIVVATGKEARNILPLCGHNIIYREHLLLDGLRILYEKNTAR